MSYKTIIVHVDSGARCQVRVELAIRLAREHSAHLVALHAPGAIDIPRYIVQTEWASIVESRKRETQEQARRAEASFNKAATAAGLKSAEWRTTDQDAVAVTTLHARYADLLVLGQRDRSEDLPLEADFVELVTLAAGRPVLVVPYAGRFDTLATRIIVAWNGSREATRALTDALPLLRKATEVQVLAINPEASQHGPLPGADIGLYLARHDVRVQVKNEHADDIDVGNVLLSRAADFGADLIVMGAYGQSRLKELVMGGASRTVIESMTVPVLLSH